MTAGPSAAARTTRRRTIIARFKLHPFRALLLATLMLGLLGGLAPTDVIKNLERGFGDVLSFVGIVIGLGTMLGGLLVRSGGADRLADLALAGGPLHTLVDFVGDPVVALLVALVYAIFALGLRGRSLSDLQAVLGRSLEPIAAVVLIVGPAARLSRCWLVKETFGLSLGDTFKSWSAMETLLSLAGLAAVLALGTIMHA